MVTLKKEEEGNFTSVTIHREEWMDIAETLLKRAKNGVRPNKRQSRKMGGISSHFFINAPNLYLEYEIYYYIKAAEAFRIIGKWFDAAKCYQQAALTQKFIASQQPTHKINFKNNNNNHERQFFLSAAILFCQSCEVTTYN